MGSLALLPLGVEGQAMLSDDRPAPQGVNADLALRPGCYTLSPINRDLIQVLSPPLGRGPCEQERRTGGSILLVSVVRLDDLYIITRKLRREVAYDLPEQVHPDAHVWREHDRYSLGCFFDLRALLLGEPRRADDEGLAVGEVLDSGFRGGELYEDFGILGGIFGGGDAYLAGAAELTEIGAELRGAGPFGTAGYLDAFGLQGGAAELAAHPT